MASRKSAAEVSTASTFWKKTAANRKRLLTYLFLFKASFLLLPILVKYVTLTLRDPLKHTCGNWSFFFAVATGERM